MKKGTSWRQSSEASYQKYLAYERSLTHPEHPIQKYEAMIRSEEAPSGARWALKNPPPLPRLT